MNVAGIVDHRYRLSGVTAYWTSMAACLEALGHSAHTLVLDDGSVDYADRDYAALVGDVHRLRWSADEGQIPMAVQRRVAAIAPRAVIHHYSDRGMALSRAVCPEARDVYVCHSDDPDHYGRVARHRDRLAGVIAVSRECQAELVGSLGLDASRTELVEYAMVAPPSLGPSATRRALPGRSFEIIYAGRVEQPQKRALDILPFVRALEAEGLDARLHIAGDGEARAALQAELGQDERVVFHGVLDERALAARMVRADAFVSFSAFEGLSTSLVQAMWRGCVPVVSSTRSGISFLRDGDNALCFPIGEPARAAALCARLAREPALACALSDRAERSAAARFAPARMRDRLAGALRRFVPPTFGRVDSGASDVSDRVRTYALSPLGGA